VIRTNRAPDETIKRRLYERSGVAEYWIVDPDLEVVRVYRNREGSSNGRWSSAQTPATCWRVRISMGSGYPAPDLCDVATAGRVACLERGGAESKGRLP